MATRLRHNHEFLMQRLRGNCWMPAPVEIVDAVLRAKVPFAHVSDVVVRCTAVENLLGSKGGADVVRMADSIGRILKEDSPDQVDPSLFTSEAEKNLWQTFNEKVVSQWQKGGQFPQPTTLTEYSATLDLLRPLVPFVDELFDNVMVNDPDKASGTIGTVNSSKSTDISVVLPTSLNRNHFWHRRRHANIDS